MKIKGLVGAGYVPFQSSGVLKKAGHSPLAIGNANPLFFNRNNDNK